MNAIEQLKSVLCDTTGKCCITGSDEDRAIVDRALQALAAPTVQEPVAWPMEEQPDGSIIPVDPSELPSDYFTTPPAAPVQEDWGPGPHEYHSVPTAAPVPMPADWFAGMPDEYRKEALRIATPPAAPVQEPVTVLPDGSAFALASFPLPNDHWLYRPHEYTPGAFDPVELPSPITTHADRERVTLAVRYAIRGATMCGKEMDFDPDALVQNAVYALCGPFGTVTQDTPPAAPVPLTDEQASDMPHCWVVIKDGRIIATHDGPSHYDGIQAVRYAPAAQPAVPLTEQQKQELAENWFAEDWAVTKAMGMMYDHERLLGITKGQL